MGVRLFNGRLIKPWPQRLAISGVLGYIVWNFTGYEFPVFATVVVSAFLVFSIIALLIPRPKHLSRKRIS